MAGSICDVCGKTGETCVASSVCGAISFAFCAECAKNNAEPTFAVAHVLESCNGDWVNINDWFKTTITIYVDGKYLPCTELKLEHQCPGCNRQSFKPILCFYCYCAEQNAKAQKDS